MATVSISRPAFIDSLVPASGGSAIAAPGTVTVAAASTGSQAPRRGVLVVAYGSLLAAALITFLYRDNLHAPFALALGASAFALFYVAAQGEERLLEPFTYFVLPTEGTKDELAQAKGNVATVPGPEEAFAQAEVAANKAAQLQRTTRERAILFWAIASIIGIGLSAILGLQFFAAILAAADPPAVPRWLDVVATGLVIGGGSKGLHDLIGKASKPASDSSASDA